MVSTGYLPVVIIFLYFTSTASTFATQQFQEWYPEWRFILNRILDENCHEEYEYWFNGQRNMTKFALVDVWLGAYGESALARPIASCILSNTSDWIKSEMASTAVLLGLTLTILACLGSSIEESSTLAIIAQKHFLVLCLAFGSPALNPIGTFEYTKPLDILKSRKHGLKFPTFFSRSYYIIICVEYLFVAGAIVNMATVIWDLGCRVSYTFAPQRVYLPMLWAFLGSVVHVVGAIALRLRVKQRKRLDRPNRLNWFYAQTRPLALQRPESF
jgi:hypothetical protein